MGPITQTFETKAGPKVITTDTPHDYLLRIGAVVTAWARFEQLFDLYLEMLHRSSEVQELGNIPGPFNKRCNRLLKASAICFPSSKDTQSIIGQLCASAIRVGRQRNRVSHCWWARTSGGTVLAGKAGRSQATYSVDPDDLVTIAEKANELATEVVQLLFLFHDADQAIQPSLPLHEIQEIRAFGSRYRLIEATHLPPPPPPLPLLT